MGGLPRHPASCQSGAGGIRWVLQSAKRSPRRDSGPAVPRTGIGSDRAEEVRPPIALAPGHEIAPLVESQR
jgi:hypothetical protein